MNSNPSSRWHPKSDLTKARILDAARRLFNEEGTALVTTNRIAAQAGLSPGNLYYHFSDKPDIIRALHKEYAAAHADRWEPAADPAVNVATLAGNLAAGFELAWRYRFFEREIRALLRADPELSSDYRRNYQRRLEEWVGFGERLVAQGLLRAPRPPRTLRDLAIALWLIAENWMAFLELTGDPSDPAQFAKGADVILAVLDPVLTAKGRRQLNRMAATEPEDARLEVTAKVTTSQDHD